VGWFDRSARTYRPISVDEQCDVLSLLGEVAELRKTDRPDLGLALIDLDR
jgi:uncharacterized protein